MTTRGSCSTTWPSAMPSDRIAPVLCAQPAARRSVPKTRAILSDGIALGHVVLHEPRVVITNYIAEDLPKEIKRLDTALAKLRADLDRSEEHTSELQSQ